MRGEVDASWRQISFEVHAKSERITFTTSIHPVGQARKRGIILENSVPHPHTNTSSCSRFKSPKEFGVFTCFTTVATLSFILTIAF